MVELIVDTQLLVHFSGTLTVMPREHILFILVESGHMVLLDRVRSHAHIVGYQLRLRQKILSFDAPADLTWDACRTVLHTWLLVDGAFGRAHLFTEIPSKGGLIDA